MRDGMTLEEAHHDGFRLVQQHSLRCVAYLGTLSAADAAAPVPDSDWTVGEVVAHLRSVYERYTIDRRRAPTAGEVSVQNAEDVERLGVDLRAAAESIEAQLAQLAAVVPHVDPTAEFPFHGGRTVTMAGGWGNLLCELLVHGDDIAAATGKPFTLPSADLEIALRYTSPLLDGWLVPSARDLDESWDLAFPFGMIRFSIGDGRFCSGAAADVPRRSTCHRLELDDASAWLLRVPYRRRPPADAVEAHLLAQLLPV